MLVRRLCSVLLTGCVTACAGAGSPVTGDGRSAPTDASVSDGEAGTDEEIEIEIEVDADVDPIRDAAEMDAALDGDIDPEPTDTDAGSPDARSPDGSPGYDPRTMRPFVVMTYNVRHETSEDTGAYAWTNRRANLLALIRARNPDILGVQEASSASVIDGLINGLQDTHDVFRPSNGSPKMIFYRRGRFTRVTGTNTSGYVGLPNPYTTTNACYANASGRTAAWVTLRDAMSSREYFVMNAHIAHGAACTLGRERAATAIRETIALRSGGRAVVLMGDFNSDPAGAPGDRTIATIETGTGAALYRSARHTGATTASEETFNAAWKSPSSRHARIDFIFTTGREITTAAQGVDRSMPGASISPSDHFAVYATVQHAIFQPGAIVDAHGNGDLPDTQLYFADVNGDRCADKIAWNRTLSSGRTRVYLSRCNGTFGDEIAHAAGASTSATTVFDFADVDGDRCADKIVWDRAMDSGNTRVFRSSCDGNFEATATTITMGASTSSATRYYWARIDADTCADRVTWNPGASSGRTQVALGACGGTVGLRTAVTNTEARGASTDASANFYFADVDGDGRADKLLWDPAANSGRTLVFRSNNDGTFTFASEHTGGSSAVPESRFHFADLDGDGRADKVFWRSDFREGRPQIYLGIGTGFAGSPIMDNPGYSQSAGTTYLFADVDGDGAVDRMYWNRGANEGTTRLYRSWY